jgi:hypothetical protein
MVYVYGVALRMTAKNFLKKQVPITLKKSI